MITRLSNGIVDIGLLVQEWHGWSEAGHGVLLAVGTDFKSSMEKWKMLTQQGPRSFLFKVQEQESDRHEHWAEQSLF